jgi:sugar-specific transcriptional regulator TrmB
MPHDIHYPILKKLGLNSSETVIYEILLEEGPKTASELVKPSGLSRGNVYNALNSLIDKGVVYEEPGKKTTYKAEDPEELRQLAEQNVKQARHTQNQLNAILPDLKSQFRLVTKQPTIRVFEGVEGLKEIYLETLKQDDDIYAFVGPDAPVKKLYEWLKEDYVKKRVDAEIFAHVIISGEEKAEKYQKESTDKLRQTTRIPHKKFPFEGEVDIFGNKIAFIGYKQEELVGFIIESPSLAKTLRSAVKALESDYSAAA